jgi:hypothetical protein
MRLTTNGRTGRSFFQNPNFRIELHKANSTNGTPNISPVKRKGSCILETKTMTCLGTKSRRLLQTHGTNNCRNLTDLIRFGNESKPKRIFVQGKATRVAAAKALMGFFQSNLDISGINGLIAADITVAKKVIGHLVGCSLTSSNNDDS